MDQSICEYASVYSRYYMNTHSTELIQRQQYIMFNGIGNDIRPLFMLRIDASNDGKSLSVDKHWINDRPMTEPIHRFNTRN